MTTPLKVGRSYRTHKYSKKDGGVTVVVEFYSGQILEYADVKYPTAYINAMKKKDAEKKTIKAITIKDEETCQK